MTCWLNLARSALLVLAGLVLSGCVPSARSQLDEEKEPHFLAGKTRVNTRDYKGAIEAFEKALEANPQSAAAHLELGLLFDQQEQDPAAAIYHYGHYLRLRPEADNGDLIKQRILAAKQALASAVNFGPVAEKAQRDFEQLAQENRRLAEENKRLREDLDKWQAHANRLQGLTNRSAGGLASRTPAGGIPATNTDPPASLAATRSHTVKAGETASLIARQYGIKLEALLAANPRLEPRRMKVGQSLIIPGS